MTITALELINSLNDTGANIVSSYSSSGDSNQSIYTDFLSSSTGLEINDLIQSAASNGNSFLDNLYVAPIDQHAENTLKGFLLGGTEEAALLAQKTLSTQMFSAIRIETTSIVSTKQAVVQYFNGLPNKTYIEKATGVIVTSQTIITETTHVPFGKWLAGVGQAAGAWAVYETFKDTVISAYNAQIGAGDSFTPLQNYLVAGAGVMAAAVAAPYLGAGLIGLAGTAVVGGVAGWVTDSAVGTVKDYVEQAKIDGKTEAEVLDGVKSIIQNKVNEYWELEGQSAVDAQLEAQALYENIVDAANSGIANSEVNVGNTVFEDIYNNIDNDNLIIQADNNEIVIDSDGNIISSILSPAEAKVLSYDARIADFESNGVIVSQTTGTVSLYGVSFDTVETIRELNGELQKVLAFNLPSNSTLPLNGVRSQIFYQEEAANGSFYIAKEETTFIDAGGREHNTLEYREGEDGNWIVQENIIQPNGETVSGAHYIVPSNGLLAALQLTGGTVGSMLGTQLADGNIYQDLVYSTFLKTVGEHFGTFTSYLAVENNWEDALEAAKGASIDGTVFENSEFSEAFFSNLNAKASSLAAGLIIDEVGEALNLGGVVGEVITTSGTSVTAAFVGETIDVVLGNLDGTVFSGLADGAFFETPKLDVNGAKVYELDGVEVPEGTAGAELQYEPVDVQGLVINALASYAGSHAWLVNLSKLKVNRLLFWVVWVQHLEVLLGQELSVRKHWQKFSVL